MVRPGAGSCSPFMLLYWYVHHLSYDLLFCNFTPAMRLDLHFYPKWRQTAVLIHNDFTVTLARGLPTGTEYADSCMPVCC